MLNQVTIQTSFGAVYVYQTREGKFHAVNFGREFATLEEVLPAVEAMFYGPAPADSFVSDQAKYAHACGYYD